MAKKGWTPKADFKPGGKPGKLHRELGVSADKPIGAARIEAATHSSDPEIKRDAVRAQTMASWHHRYRRRA